LTKDNFTILKMTFNNEGKAFLEYSLKHESGELTGNIVLDHWKESYGEEKINKLDKTVIEKIRKEIN